MEFLFPIIPFHNSAGQTEIKKFGGLLTSEFREPQPGRSFSMSQTYRHTVEGPIPDNLRALINSPRRPKGPPMHFHQFQTEYFKVEYGICVVEINGVPQIVTPEDEEISCKAGNIHQFYIHPDSPEKMTVLLSASDPGIDYQLDRVFFENWYGYWHDALLYRGGLDLIQTLQIHDAGDHYTPAPAWMPFRRFFGYWACVIIGRWIGGLLGYKPFFKEYTTDWDFAVAKMKGNFWTRRNVQDSYVAKKPWDEQVKLSAAPKPTNADYEALVTDMTEGFRKKHEGSGANGNLQVNGYGHVNGNGQTAKKRVA
ncbi:hypothetical protein K505DRAFT_407138 [Melanomma pulvis-pyrius CBS 109.77]|uniref:Uncharacterized protein n=1 Tax=Melanomma pulvis-pyrius CBS 109.77 TaxID=1314802 RepID=A0A6A6XF92_9PLEO|nr:hypothetical protein K505DRAFT_407138 [Melanomma pulvis-pyrius CBS 109.77]